MKITDAEVFVVGNPPPHFGGRYWVFVRLSTDGGVTGYGEVYSVPFHPRVCERMILDVCHRHVIGQSPFQIEKLWRRIYGDAFTLRSDVSLVAIISGIEIACWDIIGKELDRPVYDLLGGRVHERLRSYTYLYPEAGDATDVYADPDLAAERAAEYVGRGFTAVKFDPAGPYSVFDPRQLSLPALSRCEDFVRKLRQAVGDDADLLFGTHGQMTAAAAIRLARRLEPWDPMWFEEPVPPDNLPAMARVASQTRIPVATGERLGTKYEFREVLQQQAASILQPALGRCGGILEGKKIAAMAEAFYVQIAPHLYCGPIEGAANVQLDTCSPNFLIQESILDWGGFHARILKKPLQWQDGYILPPTDPGIGVELDEEVARAHPYDGDALHLDMAQEVVVDG